MKKLSKEVRKNIVESMEGRKNHYEEDIFECQADFSKLSDEDLIFYRDEWIVDLNEVLSDEDYAEDMQGLFYENGTNIYEYFGVAETT